MGCCAHSGPFVSKPLMESIGLGPLGLKNKWKVRDSAFLILEGRVAASECSSEEFHLFDTSDSPCSGGSGRFLESFTERTYYQRVKGTSRNRRVSISCNVALGEPS